MADAIIDPTASAAAPGASGRLARLAGARVAAQALGFVWFVYAARTLSPVDLGVLSSGLALVVVLGGLGDLGAARTVVRHVAAHPQALRANLRRALILRVGAGAAFGFVATIGLPAVSDQRLAVVGLAAWIAAASGATEVDFAALRSIGSARIEVRILVLERTTFTVLAVAALANGRGPLLILGIYGVTNSVSALLGAILAHRRGPGSAAAGPFFDAEGRRTAVSSSLLIVAPRASIVVLVLLSTAPAVAAFAVAQKPTEALSLLVIALAAPALPILRAKVVAGDDDGASRVAGHVAAAGLAAAGGALGWLIADPAGGLRLLLGNSSELGAAPVLRALALAAVLAVARGALELLLLAHERARQLVWATTAALVVTVAVSVALVGDHGAVGAAWGSLAGEAVGLAIVVLGAVRLARRSDLFVPVGQSLAIVGATAAVVWGTGASGRSGLAIAGVASIGGLALARHHVTALDHLG